MIKRIGSAVITATAVLFLLWFLAPAAFGVINIGNLFGIFLCAVLIFRFGFRRRYQSMKIGLCRHKGTKAVLRCIQMVSVLFVLYAMTVSGFMIYAMSAAPVEDATAVILGAQVKPWGPSPLLRLRIDAARRYLGEHPKADAVATGGQGSDEPMSEGQCIAEKLIDSGIPFERIYIEEKAVNTEENIRNSLAVINDKGLKHDIAVVTDSYHQLRARIVALKADSTVCVGAVNTENNLIGISVYPTYFVREWIAIPVEILK